MVKTQCLWVFHMDTFSITWCECEIMKLKANICEISVNQVNLHSDVNYYSSHCLFYDRD